MNRKLAFKTFFFLLPLIDLTAIQIKPINYTSKFYACTAEVTQKACQRYGLAVVGSGGGMMDSIYEMDIAFATSYPLTQAHAREILVYAADSYLEAINANSLVRPFLRNFPFVIKNLNISIFSHSNIISEDDPASTLKIASIGVNGKLEFEAGEWTRGHYTEAGEWSPSYYSYEVKETYEEAKTKLAARNR